MRKAIREERGARKRTSVKKPLERGRNRELLVRASDPDKDESG